MATVDPLFVGATRPATVMGITYEVFIVIAMVSATTFIATSNLLYAMVYLPMHAIAYLVCQKDPRQFELLKLWGETKGRCLNRLHWKAASYSPLSFQKRKSHVTAYQGMLNREVLVSKSLPYSSHVAPAVIYTAGGDFVVMFRLAGIAHESADDDSVDDWHESLNTLMRNIQSPQLCVWMHVVRRRGGAYPGGMFEPGFAADLDKKYRKLVGQTDLMVNELYVSLVWRKHTTGAFRLFSKLETTSAKEQAAAMADDLATVEDIARQVQAGLSKYLPQRLETYEHNGVMCSEAMEFLAYLVNGVWERMPVIRSPIREIIATSRPFFGKEAFELRGATESVVGGCFAIKEYPAGSAPGCLNALLTLPHELTLTQSFQFISRAKAIGLLKRVQGKMENSQDVAVSQIVELDDALDDLASNRIVMGQHHLTLTVLAPSVRMLAERMATTRACLSDCGIVAAREDVALEAAYWAQLPANFKFRPRLAPITSRNFAGFSSFHNYPSGLAAGNQWGPALAMFRTTSGTPYYFNFHLPPGRVRKGDGALEERECEPDQRVAGNTLGIGPTGSGKTVFQAFTMMQMEKYRATGVFFDKDRGAELAIRALGGLYLPLRNAEPTGFNPFQLEPTPANKLFLENLVIKIVTEGGTKAITEAERDEIRTGILGVMGLARESRRLGMLMQFMDVTNSEGAAARLKRWVTYRGETGSLAWVFDNAGDELDLTRHRLFGFDMTEFLDNADVRTPMMMYLFHRVRSLMDGRKFWMSIDECWKALQDPELSAMAFDEVKTIRKKNGFIQLWTQNAGDVLKHPMSHAFVEQCVTHIYMPNPRASYDDYVKGFKCSEREYDIVRREMPEQQLRGFLAKQGMQAAVCELNLAGFDDELAVLSGTTATVELAERIIAEVGPEPAAWLPVFQQKRREQE